MSACSSVITTEVRFVFKLAVLCTDLLKMMDLDQQLAQLLGTMTLQGVWNAKADVVSPVTSFPQLAFMNADVVASGER